MAISDKNYSEAQNEYSSFVLLSNLFWCKDATQKQKRWHNSVRLKTFTLKMHFLKKNENEFPVRCYENQSVIIIYFSAYTFRTFYVSLSLSPRVFLQFYIQ